MTFSVAEEATIALAGDNRACSNGRSGEDKCGHGNPSAEGRVPQRNPYAMDMDRRENRTCFACGGFGHMARFCRNRGMVNRKIEVDQNLSNNLNGEGDLVSPN